MRIGIDASCWTNRRGFGRFARELLRAVARLDSDDEFVLFADRPTAESADFPDGWRVVIGETSAAASVAARSDGRRSLRDLWTMRRIVQREPLDLFYFPAVYSYFPLAGRVPCMVTFHDAIAETMPKLIFRTRRSRWFWRIKCRAAARRSACVMTVSQASKTDLMRAFGLPAARVRVVSEAASAVFRPIDETDAGRVGVLRKYGLEPSGRYLLYVGGISPHKNLETLIEAFAAIAEDSDLNDVRLVLVGDYQHDSFTTCHAELLQLAGRLGVEQRVLFTGFVPDEELAHFYSAAEAFVFPSYLEGFGLPAVEAMACGAAVIASEAGSLPEVLGGAGMMFDPHDARALTVCMRRLLRDSGLRQSMRQAGLERARSFTWERSARGALDLFHEFDGPPERRGGTERDASARRRAEAASRPVE